MTAFSACAWALHAVGADRPRAGLGDPLEELTLVRGRSPGRSPRGSGSGRSGDGAGRRSATTRCRRAFRSRHEPVVEVRRLPAATTTTTPDHDPEHRRPWPLSYRRRTARRPRARRAPRDGDDHDRPVEARRARSRPASASRVGQVRVVEHAARRAAASAAGSRGGTSSPSTPVAHDLVVAGDVARDDRQPRRHRLDQHDAEALPADGRAEVERRMPRGTAAGPRWAPCRASMTRSRRRRAASLADGVAIRPVAGHDQPQVGALRREPCERLDRGRGTPCARRADPRTAASCPTPRSARFGAGEALHVHAVGDDLERAADPGAARTRPRASETAIRTAIRPRRSGAARAPRGRRAATASAPEWNVADDGDRTPRAPPTRRCSASNGSCAWTTSGPNAAQRVSDPPRSTTGEGRSARSTRCRGCRRADPPDAPTAPRPRARTGASTSTSCPCARAAVPPARARGPARRRGRPRRTGT